MKKATNNKNEKERERCVELWATLAFTLTRRLSKRTLREASKLTADVSLQGSPASLYVTTPHLQRQDSLGFIFFLSLSPLARTKSSRGRRGFVFVRRRSIIGGSAQKRDI